MGLGGSCSPLYKTKKEGSSQLCIVMLKRLFAVSALLLSSACSSTPIRQEIVSPLASPLSLAPSATSTSHLPFTVSGKLVRRDGSPLRFVEIYAAAVVKTASDFSIASVELSSPSAKTDGEGQFIFRNLAAGRYALSAAPLPGQFILLNDERGNPIMFEVSNSEEGLTIGEVRVDYPFEDGTSQ